MGDVLYLTLVSSIKEQIEKGELKPGDILDSEATLMEKFSAGRMTVRKGLSLLSSEGYIYSVPGKGNFVCKPQVDIFRFKFNKYDGLNINIDNFRLLSVIIAHPGLEISKILGLQEGDNIIECIRCLYGPNEIPVAVERIFLPYEPGQPVLEDVLKYADYMEPIERQYAFSIEKSLEINIISTNEYINNLLKLKEGNAIVEIKETIMDSNVSGVRQYVIFSVNPRYFTIKAHMILENTIIGKIY